MNEHQRVAIENHCRLSIETINPRFSWVVPGVASVVLTVNSGYE